MGDLVDRRDLFEFLRDLDAIVEAVTDFPDPTGLHFIPDEESARRFAGDDAFEDFKRGDHDD